MLPHHPKCATGLTSQRVIRTAVLSSGLPLPRQLVVLRVREIMYTEKVGKKKGKLVPRLIRIRETWFELWSGIGIPD